jgi:chromosome segregation ATPase
MRHFLTVGVMIVALASAGAAQVPTRRPNPRTEVSPRLLSDTTRILRLEARVDSLQGELSQAKNEVSQLQRALESITAGIEKAGKGKADDSSDDVWEMIRKLVDRVCKGDRRGCP